jgi:hypothetical protein
LHEVGEELEEEGDHQQADVHAVHIGIGGEHDAVVAQLFEVFFDLQRVGGDKTPRSHTRSSA